MGGMHRRLARLPWRAAAAAAACVLTLPALIAAAPPRQPGSWSLPPVTAQKSVPGHPLAADAGMLARARLLKSISAREAGTAPVPQHPHESWPSAGVVTLGVGSAAAQAGGLPVKVSRAPGSSASRRPGTAGIRAVTARVEPHAAAVRAGVHGVLMQLSAAAGTPAGGGQVKVRLSYAGFADEYGGGWSSRLRLVMLPGCALTTPDVAACRKGQPVATVNDGTAQTLTATVSLPGPGESAVAAGSPGTVSTMALVTGDTSAGTMVLAAQATPTGATGNFAATPLPSSGTWAVQQGDFTYQYPVSVPPSLGGTAPQVTLGYDAQSIDGETSAANTQAGWIGDGWNYSPGYIERSYQPCSQDGISGSGDQCWAGDNAVLSLGGRSSVLIKDDATGDWHLQGDDGSQVQLQTGADNGLWNGEYWVVTTTDGTKYYFGRGHLPGTADGGTATNSAWGVPVYTPNSGDPCYTPANGAASHCQANMGWQWNLDYAVDPAGNLTEYDYARETNYYAMGAGQSGGSGTLTSYDRGGYLTAVSYGWLLSDAAAGTANPAAEVVFASADRCTDSSASTCEANQDATHWPDVPWDLNCGSTGTCAIASPTFWTAKMLTSITTRVLTSGTAYQDVDSYALAQSFPAGADSNGDTSDNVIYLDSITRTGKDGGSLSLPAVSFDPPQELDNRVAGLVPAATPVMRPRIAVVTTSTGEGIEVTYKTPGCSRNSGGAMPSSPDANTLPCFPVYWAQPGESQIQDWFNKTLVGEVAVVDLTGAAQVAEGGDGSPAHVTDYTYLGGAAWHKNESPVAASGQRTWDEYRGYAQVEVETGTSPRAETKYTYMRGMNGDPTASGTATATVADTLGDSLPDDNWLAGQVLETDTYAAAGNSVIEEKTVNGPWAYSQTASQAAGADNAGAPTLTASMLHQSQARTVDLLAAGTWRTRAVSTYYDGNARVTAVDDNPAGSAETCTSTSYATPPAGNPMMLSYPDRVTAVTGAATAGACPAPGNADIVSDTETYYDDTAATLTSMGTLGSLSSPGGLVAGMSKAGTWAADDSEQWIAQSVTSYDKYGRVTSATDADGNTTGTAYSPATGALPAKTTVTNPKGWVTVTQLDQARQLPLSITDPNGNVTSESYDALGRLMSVVSPLDQGTGYHSHDFTYSVTGTSPSSVTETSLREDGSYATTVSIYDGVGQLREVQQPTADAEPGMLVTDTFYDDSGRTAIVTSPYYEAPGAVGDIAPAPSGTLFIANGAAVPSLTKTSYDALGRTIRSGLWSQGQGAQSGTGDTEQWATVTAYPGMDETDVTPPAGGTATSAFTNALGQQVGSWQYTTAQPDRTASHASVTTYSYTPGGQVASVTDNAGNSTTYSYDLFGRKTGESSPESGTQSWTYDGTGNVISDTTARGAVASTYDQLGRQTGQYAGSTAGTQLASWTYDTVAKGQLTSSTAYGSSGGAWTETVTGYNAAYEPTGTSTTVPSGAGFGTGAFTTANAYEPLTGLLASTSYSADGGLPAETVGYAYDLGGLPLSSGGLAPYVAGVLYSAQGLVQRTTVGARGNQMARTYQWDPGTTRLVKATTNLQTTSSTWADPSSPADAFTYTYNPAGLITSADEEENGGAGQLQCYTYNQLSQLTAAWTDNGTVTTAAAPSPEATGGCADATPAAGNIKQTAPAPYWETWTYNLRGDRTGETIHDTSGNTANDVTQAITYPAAGAESGTEPADAPQQVTTTGPGGTVAVPAYDGAGDTTSDGGTITGATYTLPGLTASVTTANGTSKFNYDASGALMWQSDPSAGQVLYLDGGAEELLRSASGTITGVRFYHAPDGTTVTRASSGDISYQAADTNGTALESIDTPSTGFGLTLSRRYYDPYGNSVGTATGWPDNLGYVGKPVDTDTRLNLLGARQYDPATGTFLSPDPVEQPGTMSAGGYTYAAGSPVTSADPTGLTKCDAGICPTPQQTQTVAQRDEEAGSSSQARINNPGLAMPGQTRVPVSALSAAAVTGWLTSLQSLNEYFSEQGTIANSRFTIMLSEVEVSTPQGPLLRIVAFVSKNGLPRSLTRQLTNAGVTIYRADPFEDHAEIAAQNYRADVAQQTEDLGGPIGRVNAAVMNNGACSVECAQGITKYIGEDGVTIQPDDRGYYGGQVITSEYMSDLRSEFGGVSDYEALIQDIFPSEAAAGGEGELP